MVDEAHCTGEIICLLGVIAAFNPKTMMMDVGKARVLKQLSIHPSVSLSRVCPRVCP